MMQSPHLHLALTLKYAAIQNKSRRSSKPHCGSNLSGADAYYGLGATRYDLGEQAAAIKELRTALELDPANAAAHRLLARLYSQQNSHVDAERELRRALASRPSAEMHFELGLTEDGSAISTSPAGECRRAIRLKPAD